MSDRLRRATSLRFAIPFGAIAMGSSCTHQAATMTVSEAPSLPAYQLSAPLTRDRSSQDRTALHIAPDSAEERVSIDTHGRDVDVRDALQFLADRGGLSLVYSPDIDKRVRLKLIDVPVSQALQAVLAVAGLTLETVGPTKAPSTTSVVFYQLPVNVDSLSVDAIMKRFGVSRTVAEMIVDARSRP
jgi:hypothetical protein